MFGQPQQPQQPQFVGRRTNFSQMPDDRKKFVMEFESKIIQPSRDAKKEVGELLDRISTQPDLTLPIGKQIDNLRIMYQQMEYMHSEVTKFQEYIRKDTSDAGRFESDVKRFEATGNVDVELPPNFYWTKYNSFIERRMNIEKTVKDLSDHVQEMENTPNDSEDTWMHSYTAVEQALQASNKVLLNIAETVRRVNTQMDGLRADYRRYREEKYSDFSDPFGRERTGATPNRSVVSMTSGRSGRGAPSPATTVQHPSSIAGLNSTYVSSNLNRSFELPGIQPIAGLRDAAKLGSSSTFGSGGTSGSGSGFGSTSSGFGASTSGGLSSSSSFGSTGASSSGGAPTGFSFGSSGASSSGFGATGGGSSSSGFSLGASASTGFGANSGGASSGGGSGFGFGSSGSSGGSGSGFNFGSSGTGSGFSFGT